VSKGGPNLPEGLLALARDDLEIARMIDQQDLSKVALGFHAQQAVEKALKAVLSARGIEYPFTHDLAFLIGLCRESDLDLPDELGAADRLAPYATTVRYGLGNPTSVDPSEAIHWAQLAISWAEEKLAG
jgi:HEPN domain-containing protein